MKKSLLMALLGSFKMYKIVALVFVMLVASPAAYARGGGHHGGYSSSYSGYSHSTRAAEYVPRDSNGRIARSPQAKSEFKHQQPCPSTGSASGACPGYVIDHVQPLKRGGADSPSNMQWQTREAAKQKDRWE